MPQRVCRHYYIRLLGIYVYLRILEKNTNFMYVPKSGCTYHIIKDTSSYCFQLTWMLYIIRSPYRVVAALHRAQHPYSPTKEDAMYAAPNPRAPNTAT